MNFKYNGKDCEIEDEETLEAAYRYKQMDYLREDADQQLNQFVFDEYDIEDVKPEDLLDSVEDFEKRYKISYYEALQMKDRFISEYTTKCCSEEASENDAWQEAIERVLVDRMNHGKCAFGA